MQTPVLGPYLLPNLRSIHWEPHSWDQLPFLRLLLNPGLVDVTIEFSNDNLHIYRPAAISLIPTRDLARLQLAPIGSDPLSMSALHNLLNQASETLRSVRLKEEPSMAVIEKLIQLPNLRHLDMYTPGTHISPPAIVFPSLEKLVVRDMEGVSWFHILRNIPNPALRELEVTLQGSSLAYLQALESFLLGANIHQTLTSFECACDEIPLTEAGLRPLLSFGRLTKLKLISSCTEGQCNSQLNDSIISELAAALPQLTHLSLGDTLCEVPTSGVTIASLVTLSTRCVDLDALRLHFDANSIISHGTRMDSQTHKFTCKLRTLSVGSLPLPSDRDDILLVTFVLLHIFPNLEIITHARKNWSQVKRAVQLFRKAPKTIPLLTAN